MNRSDLLPPVFKVPVVNEEDFQALKMVCTWPECGCNCACLGLLEDSKGG